MASTWIGTLVFTFFEKANKLHYKPHSMGACRSYASYMILISSSTWHKMTMNDNIQEKKFCLKKFKTQNRACLELWTMTMPQESRLSYVHLICEIKVKDTIIKWHAPTIILWLTNQTLKCLLSQPWHSPTIILCYMILIWNISRFIHMWIFQTKIRSRIKTNK